MSETAVAEPEVTTEPQAVTPDVPQADPEIEVGAAVDGDNTVQPETDQEDPAPVETEAQRIERLADARAAALLEQREAERIEQLRTQTTTEQQQQAWEEVKSAFPKALKDSREVLESHVLKDELGGEYRIPPQIIDKVLDNFTEYNKKAVQAAKLEAYTPISDAAYDLLPKEQHQSFTDKANGKKEKDYLEQFAEHYALASKAVKGLDLEGAKKVSAKLNKEIVEEGERRYSEGVEHGKTLPKGEPRPSAAGGPGRTLTLAQIDAMPTSQWMGMGTREERQAILDAARERESR